MSYHIATGETDGKAYIVFDTKTIGTETGYSERVVSFTMAENKAVTHQYYGEVLNWEDAWTSDYTKCMIDGNDVSVEDYCSALEKINFHDWLLLFAGNDYDTDRFCSREKIDAFIEETKDKSGSVSKASNEITGTLSKQFIGYGVGDDVECLIMTLDTPQNFCVTDTEGKTFMAENVKEVQIGAKNYNESMNGSKVKIKSYDEMFEGHSFYHIRPVVITGAELEEVKDDITVTLNGEAIEFDQSPIIVDGRTLVPLRAIFEALGATVDWNGETKTVTSTKDGTTISMTIGKAEMYKNGEVKELNVASQIVGGRTLVPVRAIAESFNVNVDWDGDTRTVILCGN